MALTPNENRFLSDLPDEVLFDILSNLPHKDLITSIPILGKRFKGLVDDKYFLKNIVKDNYIDEYSKFLLPAENKPKKSLKEIFYRGYKRKVISDKSNEIFDGRDFDLKVIRSIFKGYKAFIEFINAADNKNKFSHSFFRSLKLTPITFMDLAYALGKKEICDYIFNNCVDIYRLFDESPFSLLTLAIWCYQDEKMLITLLPSDKTDLGSHIIPTFNRTLIGLVATLYRPNEAALKFLLENGADINKKIDDNRSALDIAIEKNNISVVKMLLKNGAEYSYDLPYIDAKHWENNIDMLRLLSKTWEQGFLDRVLRDVIDFPREDGSNIETFKVVATLLLNGARAIVSPEYLKFFYEDRIPNEADIKIKSTLELSLHIRRLRGELKFHISESNKFIGKYPGFLTAPCGEKKNAIIKKLDESLQAGSQLLDNLIHDYPFDLVKDLLHMPKGDETLNRIFNVLQQLSENNIQCITNSM